MASTSTEQAIAVLDITDETLGMFGEEYEPKALVLQKALELVKIEDDPTFQRIAAAGLEAAANIKAIEAYLNPLKERRHAAWKRVCSVLNDKTMPFTEVKEKAARLCGEYVREQEAKGLRAEEEERARRQKQAEDDAAAQAEQLAQEGRVEEGIAVLETPRAVMAPVVSSSGAPRVKGFSTRKNPKYKARVTNLMALVKAVAEGKVPIVAIQANEMFLNQQARSLGTLMQYPGVAIEEDVTGSFRTK